MIMQWWQLLLLQWLLNHSPSLIYRPPRGACRRGDDKCQGTATLTPTRCCCPGCKGDAERGNNTLSAVPDGWRGGRQSTQDTSATSQSLQHHHLSAAPSRGSRPPRCSSCSLPIPTGFDASFTLTKGDALVSTGKRTLVHRADLSGL